MIALHFPFSTRVTSFVQPSRSGDVVHCGDFQTCRRGAAPVRGWRGRGDRGRLRIIRRLNHGKRSSLACSASCTFIASIYLISHSSIWQSRVLATAAPSSSPWRTRESSPGPECRAFAGRVRSCTLRRKLRQGDCEYSHAHLINELILVLLTARTMSRAARRTSRSQRENPPSGLSTTPR